MRYSWLMLALFCLFASCDKEMKAIEEEEVDVEFYFPPQESGEWETLSIENLDWNASELPDLYDFLEESDTRAFILLKNGKIVLEKYWNKGLLGQTFGPNDNWYWASSAKTLTAFMIGQAFSEGSIDLEKPSNAYLGSGWSSLDAEQENQILVRHHLSMTTGLDDSKDVHCTDPECLTFETAPDTRWAYHNGPYTNLDKVIENGTNEAFDDFFNNRLKNVIGMDGFWTYQEYNHLYFSTGRSMARFGLLLLNEGNWNGNQLLDPSYFDNMTSSSQELNPSYGYLCWLNGKSSVKFPGIDETFPIGLCKEAPDDMYAAIGKNSQIINVVPSENLVLIRMGGDPDESLVPITFQENLWQRINAVIGR